MNKKTIKFFIVILIFTFFLFNFSFVFADYIPLVSLPGLEKMPGESMLAKYLSWLFRFALAAAAFLAVLQITIGGIQMIFGGASETARTNAKTRIQDAIWGLVLALGSVLILTTISTQFKDMKLTIPEIKVTVTKAKEAGEYRCSMPDIDKGIYINKKECEEHCRISLLDEVSQFKCEPVLFPVISESSCPKCKPGLSCTGCHKLEGVAVKDIACAGGVSKCQVSPQVLTKLNDLKSTANIFGVSWQVTEAYPPTVKHIDTCHSKGTCVDTALTGPVTREKVKEFMEAAKAAGFTNVVCEYKQYPELGCKEYTTTTGGSFHIEI